MVHERLKFLLGELALTQRQFAQRINLDPGYFSKIVQGKVQPPNRILLLIETVFSVNPAWLEKGEGGIFSDAPLPLEKRRILELIGTLDAAQTEAVLAFIKYLTRPVEGEGAGGSR